MTEKDNFHKIKHDKPYSTDKTNFSVYVIPRGGVCYRVWVNDFKLPIGCHSIESINEIKEAFKDEGIDHIEEYIDGEWKQLIYKSEVYPASYRLGDNWTEAVARAKDIQKSKAKYSKIKYIDFNGYIFPLDGEAEEYPIYENALCQREDLINDID